MSLKIFEPRSQNEVLAAAGGDGVEYGGQKQGAGSAETVWGQCIWKTGRKEKQE